MAASSRKLLAYLAVSSLSLVTAIQEIANLYRAYVPERLWFDPVLALGIAGLGAIGVGRGVAAVVGNTLGAALCALLAPWACWLSFTQPAGPWVCRAAVAVLTYLGARSFSSLAKTALRPALQLGLGRYLLHPLRLIFGLGLAGGFFALEAHLGLLRTGALTAALLAALAIAAPSSLGAALPAAEGGHRWYRVAAHLALIGSAALFAAAQSVAPFAELASYPNTIVYAQDGDHERYVVTSGWQGPELYTDARVVVSPVDGHRYSEALVHPVLSVRRGAERVLLLNGGWGPTERLIARSAPKAQLTVVVPDSARMPLARRLPWLRARGIGAGVFEAAVDEPILWLARSTTRFDVIIADLAAPTDFVAGKYYTTYFLRLLTAHLENDGIAVLPAASATESPKTHGHIVATIREAGLYVLSYHAPVPTSGLQSFVLAAKRPLRPVSQPALGGAQFASAAGMRVLFQQTPDTTATVAPACSLSEQRAVDAFASERLGPRDEAPLNL